MSERKTRSMASVTDFEFIMNKIFAQKDDSPIHKALEKEGITDVEGITALMDKDIDQLEYEDEDSSGVTKLIELGKGFKSLIRCFNAFVITKYDEGKPVHGDWQGLVDKADFQDFRVIGMSKYVAQVATIPTTATTGGLSGSSSQFAPKARDLVFEFKKGIKRDPASFTVLKDNKQWDSVHRTLKAQTKYQDVDDVLDPKYVPKTAEEISLFEEKQKYMYSVLEKILQTDEGKVIVRSHDIDCDAQKIYAEYLSQMTISTEAIMSSGEYLSYLTTAKISDGSWRGTSKGFVLHWIEQLCLSSDPRPRAVESF